MYQLSKSPETGQYHVAHFGKNHKMLNSSEANGFNSKKGATKNILAVQEDLNARNVLVQDNTLRKPAICRVSNGIFVPTTRKLHKPYVPSKPKKKKS